MKAAVLIKLLVISALMLTSITGYAADWAGYNCGPDWGPTKSAAPTYPRRARQMGIEGYIIMNFSISPDGMIEDISVAEAAPSKAFVRSATRAVQAMQFPPCMSNGLATRVTDVSIKYDFNLEG